MSDASGHFVWYDLMTSDPTAAQGFYEKVLGWGSLPWDGPMPYTMFTVDEAPMSGVMELPAEAKSMGVPPHWIAYVHVPDVDATVAKVTELGGSVVVPPQDIPEVGRFATIADPHGAVIAPITLNDPTPKPAQPPVGHVSWHELMSDDHRASLEFYSALFGWKAGEPMDMGGDAGIYQLFSHPDAPAEAPAGGMMNRPEGMPVSAWLCYMRVDGLEAALDRIRDAGGQVLHEPMDVPGGDRVVQCLDPQGAAFALHEVGTGAS
ncbi:MAG: VOC family protein [Acidobacteriota bacterium]